jgi:transposase
MASAGKGTGLVGYNLQTAVDTGRHIVVAHEVINLGHDRSSLATMGREAREATGTDALTVRAERGYFSGVEVLACAQARMVPICALVTRRRPVRLEEFTRS